jgi:Fe-S cluster assembly iron-binding protein IscA
LVLDEPKKNDDSYQVDGLTYLIDKELSLQSGNVKVDFVDNGWQHGFMLSSSKPIKSNGGDCGSSSCKC